MRETLLRQAERHRTRVDCCKIDSLDLNFWMSVKKPLHPPGLFPICALAQSRTCLRVSAVTSFGEGNR